MRNVITPLHQSVQRFPSTYNIVVINGEEETLKEIQHYLVHQNEDNPAVPGYHVNVLLGRNQDDNQANLNYHFYHAASYIHDSLMLLKSDTRSDLAPDVLDSIADFTTDTFIRIIKQLKEQGSELSPFLNFYYNNVHLNSFNTAERPYALNVVNHYFKEMKKNDEDDIGFLVRISFDIMRELSKYNVDITEHDFDTVLYIHDKDTNLTEALIIEGKFATPDDFSGYRLCTSHELESEEQNEILTDGCLVFGIPTRYGNLLNFAEELASYWNVKVELYWGNRIASGEYHIENGKVTSPSTEADVTAVGFWLDELGVLDYYTDKFNLPELWDEDDFDDEEA